VLILRRRARCRKNLSCLAADKVEIRHDWVDAAKQGHARVLADLEKVLGGELADMQSGRVHGPRGTGSNEGTCGRISTMAAGGAGSNQRPDRLKRTVRAPFESFLFQCAAGP
jgi:hypothetical protein